MKVTQKSVTTTPATKRKVAVFTAEERGAMKDRVRELKADKVDGESEVRAKIAGMSKSDRAMAERLHAVINSAAPALEPRLWYGMPAYAKDGEIICHFIPAQKFKTRYATLGFSDVAHLDEGAIWPNAYALTEVSPTVEARVTALVKKAMS